MKGRLAALALLAIATGSHSALAQAPPPQCNAFGHLKDDAEKKAIAVRTALEHKSERKEICTLGATLRLGRGDGRQIPRTE